MTRFVFLGTAISFLSGCGSIALRHSFNDYNEVYAQTQNRQMLLNLARLHEREPVYFFQIAQISDSYTFSNSLSLNASKTVGLPNSSINTHTDSGILGGTATNSPIFTLIPLAGDKFAQQLLAPIKPEIFYELYEEGWPVDLLMRVLIARIELEIPSKAADVPAGNDAATGNMIVLENNPWAGADGVIVTNPEQHGPTGYYDRFLRACGLAREFQQHGLLYLDTSSLFEPAAPVGLKTPDADEIENSAKNNLAYQPVEGPVPPNSIYTGSGQWKLGKISKQTSFRLVSAGPAENALIEALRQEAAYQGPDHPLDRFRLVLEKKGFAVTDATQAKQPVRLVMRSLVAAMSALANEQNGFEYFQKQLAAHSKDPMSPDYWAPIPDSESQPALTLFPPKGEKVGSPVVSLDYARQHFVIADPADIPGVEPKTWNRDVFRLLVELSFLATSDPTAFSSPSVIQLH